MSARDRRVGLKVLYDNDIKNVHKVHQLTHISKRTIQRNFKKFGEGKGVEIEPGAGRKKMKRPFLFITFHQFST